LDLAVSLFDLTWILLVVNNATTQRGYNKMKVAGGNYGKNINSKENKIKKESN